MQTILFRLVEAALIYAGAYLTYVVGGLNGAIFGGILIGAGITAAAVEGRLAGQEGR